MRITDTFWHKHKSGFYFRVRGYGVAIDTDLPVSFSERNGYRKVWRVGRVAVQLLTPNT
jgi:hypothetical protein